MSEIEYFALCCKMREAQTKWFTTKDRKYLDESIRLEKKMDAENRRRLNWYNPQSLRIAWQHVEGGTATQGTLGI